MTSPTNTYQATVAEYAAGVRTLFAPAATEVRGRQAVDPEALAARADQLAEIAADLNRQTAGFLAADEPGVQVGAEQHLLAQATANLQVAEGLLAAAAVAGEIEAAEATRGPQRVVSFDTPLAVLETPLAEAGGAATAARAPTRGPAPQSDAAQLLATVDETLDQVLGGVAHFGQDVLTGILGLDTALLRQAAGMVSQELGDLVGNLSEQASRLVSKAVAFIVQAYDNLLAALGQDVTSEMRQHVAEWLRTLQEGEAIDTLLGQVYEVPKSRQRVLELVEGSPAPPTALGAAQAAVATLPDSFAARTKLGSQLLAGLGLLKRIPATRIPPVELATAATYIALLGFIIFVGGDYVDAPRLEKLGRIPGIVHMVETGLAAG